MPSSQFVHFSKTMFLWDDVRLDLQNRKHEHKFLFDI